MEEFKNEVLVISVVAVVCIIVIIGLCVNCRKNKQDVFLIKSCTNEVKELENIEKHIMKRLKRSLDKKLLKFSTKTWTEDRDDRQRPVIVFCAISSRIGVDIETAMRGVKQNSHVILVLLHCKLKESLKSDDLSDDEELLETEMKNRMTFIAHFAFSHREGLYACPQNKLGRKKLAKSVRKFVKGKV